MSIAVATQWRHALRSPLFPSTPPRPLLPAGRHLSGDFRDIRQDTLVRGLQDRLYNKSHACVAIKLAPSTPARLGSDARSLARIDRTRRVRIPVAQRGPCESCGVQGMAEHAEERASSLGNRLPRSRAAQGRVYTTLRPLHRPESGTGWAGQAQCGLSVLGCHLAGLNTLKGWQYRPATQDSCSGWERACARTGYAGQASSRAGALA